MKYKSVVGLKAKQKLPYILKKTLSSIFGFGATDIPQIT
jgi:hypothetical protein